MPRGTWERRQRAIMPFAYGTITLFGGTFQNSLARQMVCNSLARSQPDRATPRNPLQATPASLTPERFGLIRVRSPLLTESLLLSLPQGTEMVHFPWLASLGLCVHPRMMGHDAHRVSPFGNPRIIACLRLPEAYRSLPRPSSPLCAKASTVHP